MLWWDIIYQSGRNISALYRFSAAVFFFSAADFDILTGKKKYCILKKMSCKFTCSEFEKIFNM